MVRVLRALAVVAMVCVGVTGTTSVRAGADPALTAVLDRVGARVIDYYRRAQTITATETVRMQYLGEGLSPSGPARRLVYEFRLEWSTPESPSKLPEPNVIRRLVSVNGDDPAPEDVDACEDPRAVSPDPLFMLLPEHRREYGFSLGRPQRIDNRQTVTLDFFSLPVGNTQPSWSKECVSIPLEGRTRGRILIDAETDTVLRLEEHLVGMVEVRVPRTNTRTMQTWMNLERSDYTIKYDPVKFADPDETMMLPSTVETLRIFRGSRVNRLRTTQTYTNYQRFLTDSRMIRRPQ